MLDDRIIIEQLSRDRISKEKLTSPNPFIIILLNRNNNSVYNVPFLGAAKNFALNRTLNFGLPAKVIPYVGYSNQTYGQLLGMLLSTDIEIGSIYISSANNSQATQTLTFTENTQRGNAKDDTVIPDIHHFQRQNGLAYIEKNIIITKNTVITLSEIEATSIYTLKLFPKSITSSFGSKIEYAKPRFILNNPI